MEQAKLEESFHWSLSSQGGKQGGWEQLLVVMSRLHSKVKVVLRGVGCLEGTWLSTAFVCFRKTWLYKTSGRRFRWLEPCTWGLDFSKDTQSDWTLQMKKRGFSRAPRNLNLRVDWAGGPRYSPRLIFVLNSWGIRIHGFIQWTHQSPAEVHGLGMGSLEGIQLQLGCALSDGRKLHK